MRVTKWRFIEHDSDEHADYYEREVCRDDGKVVVQIMCKGDGLSQKCGKVNNDPPRIHHQFFREERLCDMLLHVELSVCGQTSVARLQENM